MAISNLDKTKVLNATFSKVQPKFLIMKPIILVVLEEELDIPCPESMFSAMVYGDFMWSKYFVIQVCSC